MLVHIINSRRLMKHVRLESYSAPMENPAAGASLCSVALESGMTWV